MDGTPKTEVEDGDQKLSRKFLKLYYEKSFIRTENGAFRDNPNFDSDPNQILIDAIFCSFGEN